MISHDATKESISSSSTTETLVIASCTIMTVCIMLIALYLFEHAIKTWHLFLNTFGG